MTSRRNAPVHGVVIGVQHAADRVLHGARSALGRALPNSGGDPSLGDVVVATGGDLFAQMCCALAVARMTSNQAALDAGSDPETVSPAAGDMLRATTIAGARAIGLEIASAPSLPASGATSLGSARRGCRATSARRGRSSRPSGRLTSMPY